MLLLRFGKFFARLLCVLCLFMSVTAETSHAATPLDDNTEFVKQVYRDFLNREADAGGLAYWVSEIEAGKISQASVVENYIYSAEFGENVAPVTRLYFAYFNRIPDYSGLMYWVGQYGDGTELAAISNAFADSGEFATTYGSLSNNDFVSLVYQNVLGRGADASGLAYWAGELDSGTRTRGQVMVGFSESDEYKSQMYDEIYVNMTYMGLLRRAPDQSGFDYWVDRMESGGSGLSLIDGFLLSDEYQGRFDGTWLIRSLEISGPRSVNKNSSAKYVATATWMDGRTSLVGVAWSENSANADVNSLGVLDIGEMNLGENIALKATYIAAQNTHRYTLIVSEAPNRTFSAAYVQWRTYEDSNRDKVSGWLGLPRGMKYEEAVSLTLKNSSGGTIASLSDFNQDGYYSYYTQDCRSGTCISSFFKDGGWYDTLNSYITNGVYTYTLETSQGSLITKDVNYLGIVRMPIISSASIFATWNNDGSLTVNWENPSGDSAWNEVKLIRLYLTDENWENTYMVTLNPTVQSFTVSAYELSRAFTNNELGSLNISLQTRAYDDQYNTNFARGYSNWVSAQ